ncbi:glycosyltransferase family 2 protein [uncultured Dokdonia sp.]|uniref:glycosyltransferase family 2 protein n=1 Tax=uncultured Dokdonia sp. TaxID=575653 RepID=UPI0030EC160B|tara:strand:- start:52805 stop:54211 length:1407 start_codon:yes stop_codon:yes gene_type:complete
MDTNNNLPEELASTASKKHSIAKKIAVNPWGTTVLITTFLLLVISAYIAYMLRYDFSQLDFERKSTVFGYAFMTVASVFLAYKSAFFLYTLYNYFRYKPVASVTDAELPTVTVIVPAYNEGKQVYATLQSLAASDYPVEKIQLLSIDDGSQDDTWHWMQVAKRELGNRVSICQQSKNMGKRHALYRGFHEGSGEVFITVDSDSIVTPDTLRNLVSPFVNNEDCGAVAGNIRVLNNEKALLPKMLDVSFVLSFEFVRSAESNLNSVLCTPGALAAYRRDAVFACLEEWIDQTFMGKPSDIGEDRAMTNMILSQGKHVLFQKNAFAYTNVPENYKGLYKMFIRWGRSNVRENIAMAKYVFTDFRKESKAGTRLLFISQSLEIIMTYPFLAFMLFFIATHPVLFLTSTLVSILILSTFPALFYGKKYNIAESFYAYSYSLLYTFGLFWITPYAIATAGKSGWLTRSLPQVA